VEFQRQYNVQTTLVFCVELAGSSALAATADWTPATGDVKISKDGGAVANTTNLPSAVTGTGSVLWALTLTATEMQAQQVTIQIVDAALKDQVLVVSTRLGGQVAATGGIWVVEVDNATFTATSTNCEALSIAPTTAVEATPDHFNGRLLLFTSGAAKGELTTITDYSTTNSKMNLTYDALVSTPTDGDTAVIL